MSIWMTRMWNLFSFLFVGGGEEDGKFQNFCFFKFLKVFFEILYFHQSNYVKFKSYGIVWLVHFARVVLKNC